MIAALSVLSLTCVLCVGGVSIKTNEFAALQSFVSASQCSVAACVSISSGNATCPSDYITCDASGSVTSISLFNVGLTGSLSASLGQLSNLQTLLLARNSLLGTVPTAVGLLTRLSALQLYDNPRLTGTLPTEVLRLTALTHAQRARLRPLRPLAGARLAAANAVNVHSWHRVSRSAELFRRTMPRRVPMPRRRLARVCAAHNDDNNNDDDNNNNNDNNNDNYNKALM
jgi:hypothetical protein